MNLLVVDDSAVMRSMILRTLRLSGLAIDSVVEAANGAEGLAALRSQRVDVALVDLNMPIMSGEEMIEQARSEPGGEATHFVVVSTESGLARVEALRRHGADFVHKPFTPEALRRTILRITGAST